MSLLGKLFAALTTSAPLGALAHPGHGALAHSHGELVLVAVFVGLVLWTLGGRS